MTSAELIQPAISDVNRGFWDATARGELAIQRCDDCTTLRYPVSEVCPSCLSTATTWATMSGRGSLYSWIVFHHAYHAAWADRLPYNVGLVQLDEGPMLFSNIVAPAGTTFSLGMPLQVVFEQEGDFAIPRFRPVA